MLQQVSSLIQTLQINRMCWKSSLLHQWTTLLTRRSFLKEERREIPLFPKLNLPLAGSHTCKKCKFIFHLPPIQLASSPLLNMIAHSPQALMVQGPAIGITPRAIGPYFSPYTLSPIMEKPNTISSSRRPLDIGNNHNYDNSNMKTSVVSLNSTTKVSHFYNENYLSQSNLDTILPPSIEWRNKELEPNKIPILLCHGPLSPNHTLESWLKLVVLSQALIWNST